MCFDMCLPILKVNGQVQQLFLEKMLRLVKNKYLGRYTIRAEALSKKEESQMNSRE